MWQKHRLSCLSLPLLEESKNIHHATFLLRRAGTPGENAALEEPKGDHRSYREWRGRGGARRHAAEKLGSRPHRVLSDLLPFPTLAAESLRQRTRRDLIWAYVLCAAALSTLLRDDGTASTHPAVAMLVFSRSCVSCPQSRRSPALCRAPAADVRVGLGDPYKTGSVIVAHVKGLLPDGTVALKSRATTDRKLTALRRLCHLAAAPRHI